MKKTLLALFLLVVSFPALAVSHYFQNNSGTVVYVTRYNASALPVNSPNFVKGEYYNTTLSSGQKIWKVLGLSAPVTSPPLTGILVYDYDAAIPVVVVTMPLSCQAGLGDGFNAIPAGTYLQTVCVNQTGKTWNITGVKCYSDNSGTSTMNVTNGANSSLVTTVR